MQKNKKQRKQLNPTTTTCSCLKPLFLLYSTLKGNNKKKAEQNELVLW